MIPLRDTIKSKTFPIVNLLIILINLGIFVLELSLNRISLEAFFYQFGFIPNLFTQNLFSGNIVSAFYPLVTATFLHSGWMHIIGNMLFLWVFGDNIEDKLGHSRYLIFYLLVGIIGNLTQYAANTVSDVPLVGASGAVAGILGAYVVSYPKSRVLSLIFIFFFFTITEIKSTIFIIIWFILQVFNGVASLTNVGNSVAWWAHVGGFLAGVILIRFFIKKDSMIFG